MQIGNLSPAEKKTLSAGFDFSEAQRDEGGIKKLSIWRML
jgi:hypothetical protein